MSADSRAKAPTRSLSLDATNADAHFNLAQLYEDLGQKEDALRELQIYRQMITA